MASQPIESVAGDDTPSGNPAESEARLLGWKSPDEFKGPADKALSAEDFLAKRNDNVGMLRNDYAKLERQFRDLEKRSQRAEREGFNRAMDIVAKKQREAVETGDTAAFDDAEKERKKLEKDAAAPAPVDVEQRQEEFIEWRADNLWYGENKLLSDYADTAAEKMMKEKGGFLGPDDLAAVARKVKDRFGQKFPDAFGDKPAGKDDDEGEEEKPRRRSPVEGVSQVRGKGGAKTAADLDARAKDVGNSLVKMGLYKDLNEYAKDLYK